MNLSNMDALRGIFFVLHLVGMAGVIGGFMVQLSEPVKRVTRTMLDGMWTALASGGVLTVLAAQDERLMHPKIEFKGMVSIALALLLISGKKKESIDKAVYFAIGLLALANVFIAILWQK